MHEGEGCEASVKNIYAIVSVIISDSYNFKYI